MFGAFPIGQAITDTNGRQQSDRTEAWLHVDAKGLEVSNLVSKNTNQNSAGHGFGHEINRKLCQAIGWQFITSEDDELFRVRVEFR